MAELELNDDAGDGDGDDNESPDQPAENPGLEALLGYLKRARGFDFTPYKRPSLGRRIDKRMAAVGAADYPSYVDYLEVHPEEFGHLFNTILINVTSFFRDPAAWEGLRRQVLPRLLEAKGPADPIRVWSAGCASGEESYTLAMALAEVMGLDQAVRRVKVFATDVDEQALRQARHATYAPRDLAGVPPDLRERYFEPAGGRLVFHKDLRRAVIFGRHDLLTDAPISRVDLIACRNVLMYFHAESQAKILERFHFALNEGGFLFLGKAEMLFARPANFAPVDVKRRLFVKVGKGTLRDRLLAVAQGGNLLAQPNGDGDGDGDGDGTGRGGGSARLREVAFETDPAAQLVVDAENCVVLANEAARELFGLTRHDVGRPVQDLRLSYQPIDLRSVIDRVRAERHLVVLKDVGFPPRDGAPRFCDLHVVPLADPDGGPDLLGVKAVYADVTRFKQLQDQLEQSNRELELAYEELQSSNEEKETTNEELQSTVEELETTNEELQSSNEELETMNEELQSTNEELQAINDELRDSTTELNRVNAFLGSVLASLKTGVVVVDRDLKVLAWNERAEDLWGLRDGEVAGKHFMNLDIGLPVERLRDPIRDCLAGDGAHAVVVVGATNRRGRAIQCRVSCTPLHAADGAAAEVRGVILLMEEDAPKPAGGEQAAR